MAVVQDFPEDLAAYDEALEQACLHDRPTAEIDKAIEVAERLVQCCPDDADAYHLLGLAWYHFPASASVRSWRIRRALERAIEIDANHQLALQYLAYLAFDQERYADALAFQERLRRQYFVDEMNQEWRALKNLETSIVCRIRLFPDSFPDEPFEEFVRWYLDARHREEHHDDHGSNVPAQELRECAEWLYECGAPLTDDRLVRLLTFIAKIDYTQSIRSPVLQAHAKSLSSAIDVS